MKQLPNQHSGCNNLLIITSAEEFKKNLTFIRRKKIENTVFQTTYLFTTFISPVPLIVTVYFIATKNKDALPNALLPKKTNVFSTHEDVISKDCHSQNDRNPSILILQYEPPGLQLLTNENTSCRRSAINVQSSEN